MAKTLYDKIWESHLVDEQNDGTSLLYIDRHLVHEVTSPQAFEGLRLSNRKVKLPGSTLAVVDHNVPTTDRSKGIADKESAIQVETLSKNCKDFGIEFFGLTDKRQGIVHVIGPEQGFTQPGMTIVCGDSHTSTHGARTVAEEIEDRGGGGEADAQPPVAFEECVVVVPGARQQPAEAGGGRGAEKTQAEDPAPLLRGEPGAAGEGACEFDYRQQNEQPDGQMGRKRMQATSQLKPWLHNQKVRSGEPTALRPMICGTLTSESRGQRDRGRRSSESPDLDSGRSGARGRSRRRPAGWRADRAHACLGRPASSDSQVRRSIPR